MLLFHSRGTPTACDPEVAKVLVKTLEEAVAVAHKASSREWAQPQGRAMGADCGT